SHTSVRLEVVPPVSQVSLAHQLTGGLDEMCVCVRTAEDTCGGTVRGGSGVVTSPGYPGNYGNQADCTWILLAEPGDTISLIFTDFQTEEKYDYLEVEGSEPPTIW
ncbi:hypothetical protein JOQ06_015653, partial [Pogonophryne albipinna]